MKHFKWGLIHWEKIHRIFLSISSEKSAFNWFLYDQNNGYDFQLNNTPELPHSIYKKKRVNYAIVMFGVVFCFMCAHDDCIQSNRVELNRLEWQLVFLFLFIQTSVEMDLVSKLFAQFSAFSFKQTKLKY